MDFVTQMMRDITDMLTRDTAEMLIRDIAKAIYLTAHTHLRSISSLNSSSSRMRSSGRYPLALYRGSLQPWYGPRYARLRCSCSAVRASVPPWA